MVTELGKLYLGDNKDLLKTIPDKSIDLVLTDPPYFYENMQRKERDKQTYLSGKFDKLHKGLVDIKATEHIDYNYYLNEFKRVLKSMNLLIWCNKHQLKYYIDWCLENNTKWELIIWEKTNPIPINNIYYNDKEYCFYIFNDYSKCYQMNYLDKKTVYHYPIGKEKTGHPTTKPLQIIKQQILKHSEVGDTVLDCFLGSGTTALACEQLNRKWIGMELSNKYYNIAKKRLSNIQQQLF